MPHDFAPPRPPYSILYRAGLNNGLSLSGNSMLKLDIDSVAYVPWMFCLLFVWPPEVL